MKVLISDKINESALTLLKDKNIDYDYLPEITPDVLKATIVNYTALIVRSRTKVTKDIIEAGKIKVIGRVGSGVDNIDMVTARKRKIIVVNAPLANCASVAELTIGLILSLLRKLDKAYSSMREGLWLKKELTGQELNGKTVGIVGYGNIGQRVQKIVEAFGAKVLYFSRKNKNCALEELFNQADMITIHLALTPETKGLINVKLLNLMKSTAYLINTARGEIVDEEDLYEVLLNKKISGAALDVYSQEPLSSDSKWRKLDNCILTPHIGASTKEALKKASLTVLTDIGKVLIGKSPENVVK